MVGLVVGMVAGISILTTLGMILIVAGAVLWVLGQHYDVFGWENPKYANPEAAAAITKAGLAPMK